MFSGHAHRDNPSGHGRRVGPGDCSDGRKRRVRDGCHSAMPRGMPSGSSVHADAGLVLCTTTIFASIYLSYAQPLSLPVFICLMHNYYLCQYLFVLCTTTIFASIYLSYAHPLSLPVFICLMHNHYLCQYLFVLCTTTIFASIYLSYAQLSLPIFICLMHNHYLCQYLFVLCTTTIFASIYLSYAQLLSLPVFICLMHNYYLCQYKTHLECLEHGYLGGSLIVHNHVLIYFNNSYVSCIHNPSSRCYIAFDRPTCGCHHGH